MDFFFGFFLGIFLRISSGGIFFGGFFWEDFLGGFLGGNSLFTLLSYLNMEGNDVFVKIWIFVKILAQFKEGRKII